MGSLCCKDDSTEQPTGNTGYRSVTTGGGRDSRGGGKALGGAGVTSESGVSASSAAAMAAMQRANSQSSSTVDRKLADRRQKDELVGRIQAHYQALNKDPPIGLAASSIDALRKHLDHIKAQSPA
uniref:Uncharacterized protein n=1 Tax=Rhizochromulina marina TaxID=1034831 RepID=A0A7S2WD05_9STRA|mmetsp:Transcript_2103/g.6062  ORF Transcript_2103/g.6062 Transcript_2103/m.6062 type:complete len:125 (+) Transcript_2103:103-477(+)|eukprot:CAMPEP_0118974350 /NCGR_PEP_ID=MMETSP1173-20130426/11205_1 /TAXON_ID=1034831 /ORGANISM="Rhizochromulina marina cf, Strain CCMP1243" /LENGTH=124 /DNA_ID=CAMNT_0006924069 /DNA_START=89 /DNA_END=463 /DNA_ORIENTATION=+